jgi:hypothetical protein
MLLLETIVGGLLVIAGMLIEKIFSYSLGERSEKKNVMIENMKKMKNTLLKLKFHLYSLHSTIYTLNLNSHRGFSFGSHSHETYEMYKELMSLSSELFTYKKSKELATSVDKLIEDLGDFSRLIDDLVIYNYKKQKITEKERKNIDDKFDDIKQKIDDLLKMSV